MQFLGWLRPSSGRFLKTQKHADCAASAGSTTSVWPCLHRSRGAECLAYFSIKSLKIRKGVVKLCDVDAALGGGCAAEWSPTCSQFGMEIGSLWEVLQLGQLEPVMAIAGR
ncbi:unnamed protein product [Durusdinium trenchii]|uniref:Uncharacterized protein n=1 Tax=Durusdinium trenchii TaxID=1381693 RepID=A0ABP0MW34_9DINO